MSIGITLIYGGAVLLGLTLTKLAFSFARAYRAAKRDLK